MLKETKAVASYPFGMLRETAWGKFVESESYNSENQYIMHIEDSSDDEVDITLYVIYEII